MRSYPEGKTQKKVLSHLTKQSVVSKRIKTPDLIRRVWVGVLVVTLVSSSKKLNHYCSVLCMGFKAIGPVCYVMNVKEPSALVLREWVWLYIVPTVPCKP